MRLENRTRLIPAILTCAAFSVLLAATGRCQGFTDLPEPEVDSNVPQLDQLKAIGRQISDGLHSAASRLAPSGASVPAEGASPAKDSKPAERQVQSMSNPDVEALSPKLQNLLDATPSTCGKIFVKVKVEKKQAGSGNSLAIDRALSAIQRIDGQEVTMLDAVHSAPPSVERSIYDSLGASADQSSVGLIVAAARSIADVIGKQGVDFESSMAIYTSHAGKIAHVDALIVFDPAAKEALIAGACLPAPTPWK